jgi:uroporphyrinogen-III synthase
MRLLLTRPETDGEPDSLEAGLVAAGHRIMCAPLLSIAYTGTLPPLDGVQALIATSRNGLKAVAGTLSDTARALPLFAVGPATAALGRQLGFQTVVEGAGTGRALYALIEAKVSPSGGSLVHLVGDRLAYDLKGALEAAGFTVRAAVVYQTREAESLPPQVVATLQAGGLDGVILMSPRTARVYARLAGDAGIVPAVRPLVHFCLSEAVGRELASLDPVRLAVASLPNSQEILALIAREAPDSL